MQLVIIAIGVVIALIVIGIIKITHKNDFSDEYEIDFEKKHKGNFVNRFETNYFDFRNHID